MVEMDSWQSNGRSPRTATWASRCARRAHHVQFAMKFSRNIVDYRRQGLAAFRHPVAGPQMNHDGTWILDHALLPLLS